jgi:hypothetical protein
MYLFLPMGMPLGWPADRHSNSLPQAQLAREVAQLQADKADLAARLAAAEADVADKAGVVRQSPTMLPQRDRKHD